jgi:hypothetical protein
MGHSTDPASSKRTDAPAKRGDAGIKIKRKKPFAANNASLKKLESEGWTVTVVEQRIPKCFITRDAYGFGDLLACSPTRGILIVQATGGSNLSTRIKKVKAEPRHAIWLASGGRIKVHSWIKRPNQKSRECKIFEITATQAIQTT